MKELYLFVPDRIRKTWECLGNVYCEVLLGYLCIHGPTEKEMIREHFPFMENKLDDYLKKLKEANLVSVEIGIGSEIYRVSQLFRDNMTYSAG